MSCVQLCRLFFTVVFVFKLICGATLSECQGLLGTAYYNNCTSKPDDFLVVQTDSGPIGGLIQYSDLAGMDVKIFKGIPYAKPPVGVLRFENPSKPTPWNNTRWTLEHGSICTQLIIPPIVEGSEDCLYLNVYSPKNCTKAKKCPVMVYFHSGGFAVLSGNSDVFGGYRFNREEVVFVSLNYRLTVLGFANTGDQNIKGNAGLMDQTLALYWVQSNIAQFGGERGLVTIFGEGSIICFHCFAEMSRGLFSGIIHQSGSCLSGWAYQPNPVTMIKYLAGNMSISFNGMTDLTNKLRAQSATDLVLAATKMLDTYRKPIKMRAGYPFAPAVDKMLPSYVGEEPNKFLEEQLGLNNNICHGVAVIAGTVLSDGGFQRPDIRTNPGLLSQIADNNELLVPPRCGFVEGSPESKAVGKKIYDFHFGPTATELNYYNYTSMMSFIDGTIEFARFSARSGIYPYVLNYNLCGSLNFGRRIFFPDMTCDQIGPILNDDHSVLFSQTAYRKTLQLVPGWQNVTMIPESERTPIQIKISKQITRLFANFARTGNPNGCMPDPLIDVKWEPYNGDLSVIETLNFDETLTMVKHPHSSGINFWHDLCNLP